MDVLAAHLDAALARTTHARRARVVSASAVDRSFTLAGLGTVVTGTVLSGTVRARRSASWSARRASKRACARSTRRIGRSSRARPGERCALVLSGPQHQQGRRAARRRRARSGAARADRAHRRRACACWPPSRSRSASGCRCKVHHAAAEVPGRIVVLRDERDRARRDGLRAARAGAADRGGVGRPLHRARHLLEPHDRRRHAHRPARARAASADARASRRDRRAMAREAIRRRGARRCSAGPDAWIDIDAFARDRALGAVAVEGMVSELSLVTFPLADGPRRHAPGRLGAPARR